MTVMGFSFHKINVEKKKSATGPIRISNNARIRDITQTDVNMGISDRKGLVFEFEFTSKYEPGVGSMIFDGSVIYLESEKKMKEILQLWKKNKRVSRDVMTPVLNNILSRCTIQALIISREMNMPPPIQLPKIRGEVSPKKVKK